jgi:hypothetical protein
MANPILIFPAVIIKVGDPKNVVAVSNGTVLKYLQQFNTTLRGQTVSQRPAVEGDVQTVDTLANVKALIASLTPANQLVATEVAALQAG